MNEIDKRINRFVRRVRRRLREQCVIENLMFGSSIGLGIGIILCGIALLIPFYYSVLCSAVFIFVCMIYGIVQGFRHTPKMERAALMVDAKGYQEKISTALFLQGKTDAFSSMQKTDAVGIVDQFEIRKEFPIHIKKKQFIIVVCFALFFSLFNFVDTPARKTARMLHEVQKEKNEEIAELEKIEKKISENTSLSEQERKELLKQLEESKKELKAVASREEMAKMKERLSKKMELASNQSKNQFAKDLLKETAEKKQEQIQHEKEQLKKDALEALEKAKTGSKSDKKEAVWKMEKLAAKTGDSNLQLAAQNYNQTNQTDASYAEAKNAVQKSTQPGSYEGNPNSSNNDNQDMAMKQNGNSQSSGNKSQGNQQSNKGAEGQQGEASGKEKGNNSASGQGGTSGQSGTSGNAGSGWNSGGKEGKEGLAKTNETITIPEGTLGNDENLTGKANGNQSSIWEKSEESNAWAGNKVSYGSVSGQYKERAYSKMNQSSYPSEMKEKIRSYFDGLN